MEISVNNTYDDYLVEFEVKIIESMIVQAIDNKRQFGIPHATSQFCRSMWQLEFDFNNFKGEDEEVDEDEESSEDSSEEDADDIADVLTPSPVVPIESKAHSDSNFVTSWCVTLVKSAEDLTIRDVNIDLKPVDKDGSGCSTKEDIYGFFYFDILASTFKLHSEKVKYLHDGHFIIQVSLRFSKTFDRADTTNIRFSNMLQTGKFSDVTFVVENREFTAHRIILASRCNYFDAMFSNNFKESNEAKVTVHDVKATVFDKILKFIYGDSIGEMKSFKKDFLMELYTAADKFGITLLAEKCEQVMKNSTGILDYFSVLKFADQRGLVDLKSSMIKEIAFNINNNHLMETEIWNDFEFKYPYLAIEILKQTRSDDPYYLS